ncbi:hypothetical protein GCM10010140_49900 [Streptosporangium pseudovulgare]|uniref:Uncharacterized protein n=1 Tax=Streptosporangium pseudovulgare TaxID=35765 RepID=A0ABQ2R8D7_9ACTN|nr:hypothetical protein GCM10010140_49900 [Streptosporangium pseudovulgare]
MRNQFPCTAPTIAPPAKATNATGTSCFNNRMTIFLTWGLPRRDTAATQGNARDPAVRSRPRAVDTRR